MQTETLEELIESKNTRILVDTSAFGVHDISPNGFRQISRARSFEDMGVNDLEIFIEILENYTKILESDKIVVIPEVRDERQRFKNSFDGHYRLIKGIDNTITRKMVNKSNNYKRENRNYVQAYSTQELFDELTEQDDAYIVRKKKPPKRQITEQETLYKKAQKSLSYMQNTINSKILAIKDPLLYNEMNEVAIDLVYAKNLKSKSHPQGIYEYEDIHTDEILIATGIYLAIKNKEQITIATCDSSFGKILRYYNSLLCSFDDGQVNQLLRENSVDVCFLSTYVGNNVKLTTDTSMKVKFDYDGIDTGKVQRVVGGLLEL